MKFLVLFDTISLSKCSYTQQCDCLRLKIRSLSVCVFKTQMEKQAVKSVREQAMREHCRRDWSAERKATNRELCKLQIWEYGNYTMHNAVISHIMDNCQGHHYIGPHLDKNSLTSSIRAIKLKKSLIVISYLKPVFMVETNSSIFCTVCYIQNYLPGHWSCLKLYPKINAISLSQWTGCVPLQWITTLIRMKMHLDCVLRSRRSKPKRFCHAVNFTACPLKTESLITQYPAGFSGSLLMVTGPFNQCSASVTVVTAKTWSVQETNRRGFDC